MRRKIAAGNWKLNTSVQEGLNIAKQITDANPSLEAHQHIMFFPPFTHLSELGKLTNGNNIHVGAQNISAFEQGAYTGEVSVEMVNSCGANNVIIGHSERRSLFGENYDILKTKVDLVISSGMELVFCCGETLEEREAGKEHQIVKEQLEGSLFHLTKENMQNVIIAYEPVWAIGTGKTASPEQAQDMHAYIRTLLKEVYDETVAMQTSILYGGSVKGSNANALFSQTDIDGGLVGGASLKPDDFLDIIKALP